jgi:hypothetical protein
MSAVVRRTGALLAAGSAVLHGLSLGGGALMTTVMAAMIAACAYCAYELWTRDTIRGWVLVALMNLAMVGIHLPIAGGHHHGPVAVPASGFTPMMAATSLAVLEIVLAVAVLFHRTRRPQLT